MRPRGGSSKRFAFTVAVATVLAGVALAGATAASFDDSRPCPAQGPLLVCPGGLVGKPYSLQLIGKGGCDLYRWEIVNSALPPGLSMTSSGLISGTPTGAGTAQFWVIIHDLLPEEGGHPWCIGDNQSERQYVIPIDSGLSIDNQSVKPGTVGQAYSETLTATQVISLNPVTGAQVAATWSVQSGTLPPGVTITPGGALEGIPTAEGTYQFVVQAQNGIVSDTETLTLVVRQPVVISSPFSGLTPPRSEVGVPFTATLTAAGGDGTFTWALQTGLLPTGIVLGPDGTISGTPLASGGFPFTVSVTDGELRTTTLNATLTVAAKLAIKTLLLRPAKVGRLYRAKIATLGGIVPTKWKILRGTLPRGVRFDKKLGLLLGTPRREGRYRVRFQVVDALGVTSQRTLAIVVTA